VPEPKIKSQNATDNLLSSLGLSQYSCFSSFWRFMGIRDSSLAISTARKSLRMQKTTKKRLADVVHLKNKNTFLEINNFRTFGVES